MGMGASFGVSKVMAVAVKNFKLEMVADAGR
jgi:hypothetical protein